MKQRLVFFLLSFVGLLVLSNTYSFFRVHLGEEKILRAQVAHLSDSLEQQRFRVAIKESELGEMKAVIARNLSNFKNDSENEKYTRRNIASVVSHPLETQSTGLDLSASLFNDAQKSFNEKSYKRSAKLFSQFVEDYPVNERTTEAYYLWSESLYLGGEAKKTLDLVKVMMTQFPDNPLTGYSLLRMGQILESNGRKLDAQQIYASVQGSYKQAKLKEKAKNLEKNLEL